MLSDSTEENTKEWDYKCPQFCDFNAPETWRQNKDIDQFFAIDHEKGRRQSSYSDNSFNMEGIPIITANKEDNHILIEKQSLIDCPNDNEENINKSNHNNIDSEDHKSKVKMSSKYETPPQNMNKENVKDDEDNDVFYSTKKSLTIEKKSAYKLRSTAMRILQHNGVTPLRETRISSSKKKRNRRSKQVLVNQEVYEEVDEVFNMNELVESLPSKTPLISQTLSSDNENETKIEREGNEEENENKAHEDNDNIDLTVEKTNKMSTTGRASYVIENRVHKSVRLISPVKSAKTGSSVKRSVNSIRKKGTPIRKPTVERKVRSQSISSSLYSAVKTSSTKYKSMAELVNEFETKPRGYDRSRSLDRNTCGQRSRSSSVSSLTRPISPKLHAMHRHRCNSNQLEREEMIAQEIKKYAFKANPIRKKLFDAKFASGIPIVKSTKAPTKAIGMSFLTQQRNQIRSTKLSASEDKSDDKEKTRFRAQPMPAFKNPLQVFHVKSEKKMTAFKPFSFDVRDKNVMIKKQQNLENSEKSSQKMFNFNARKSFKF